MAAPRLTAAGSRNLALGRSLVEQAVIVGGHQMSWDGTFTTVQHSATEVRAQDGWCSRCRRLRAVIWADDATGAEIRYAFGRPNEPCQPR